MDWLDLRYSSWPGWCATWKWQVRSSLGPGKLKHAPPMARSILVGHALACPFSSRVAPLGLHTHYARKPAFSRENERTLHCYRPPWLGWAETVGPALY